MTEEMEHNILPEEPVETQALTAARKADMWVRESLTPIEEELLDGAESLRDLPPTYTQAGLLHSMLPELDEEGKTENWLDLLGVDLPSGFLFCGPSGCGKRDTAWAMLGDLRKFGYEQLLYLTGSELNLKSAKKVKKCMKALYRYAEEESKVVLLLDHISACRCGRWMMDFVSEQQSNIFTILLEDQISACNLSLRREFPCISFPLPDKQARLEFLEYHMRGELDPELLPDTQEEDLELTDEDLAVLDPDMQDSMMRMTGLGGLDKTTYQIELDDMTQEALAEETEGFSYQQMKQLTDLMRFELMQMLQENTAMELVDAANALTAGGRYRIKSYTIQKMVHILKYQMVSEFTQQVPVYMQNAVPMHQMKGVNQGYDTSIPVSMSEAERKIMEAAKGGKKDYGFLAQYFSGSVGERFGRSDFGEIQEVYVKSKESESDLEEAQNLNTHSPRN